MLSNLKGFEGLRTYLHRSLRMISSCMQLQNLIGFHWVAAAMPSSQIYPSRSGYFDLLMDRTTRSRHASSNTRLVLSTSNSSLIPSPLNIKFEQQLVPRSAGNFKLQMDSSLRAGSTKLMSSQRLALGRQLPLQIYLKFAGWTQFSVDFKSNISGRKLPDLHF